MTPTNRLPRDARYLQAENTRLRHAMNAIAALCLTIDAASDTERWQGRRGDHYQAGRATAHAEVADALRKITNAT